MKTWVLSAGAVAMAMVAACSAGSSTGGTTTTGGTGGKTTTVSASHNAVSSGSTGHGGSTGTGTMDMCTSGADCTTCPDQMSCYNCAATAHPTGSMLFDGLISCIFCTACYTVCESSTQMGLCTGAPPTKDACDTGTPSMPGAGTACGDANGGCAHCSQQMGASCYMANQACTKSSDCIAYDMALQACPTM